MDQLLRVLVIANDTLTRAGLAAILRETDALDPVGQVATADDLEQALSAYRPDLILWDLGLPTEDDLERLGNFAASNSSDDLIPLVLLLQNDEMARAVWQRGVQAVIGRNAPPDRLVAACRGVYNGLLVLDDQFADVVTSQPQLDLPLTVEPLTPREQEVMQLMAQGLPNKTIARDLSISEHTVKFHVNGILTKFNAQSRTEAVVLASRAGLVVF